jgi:5-methylcytosine-specific restriction endonuclease McrA
MAIRIQVIRDATTCEHCGAQPIQWHHLDHAANPQQRISNLVWRSAANYQTILTEIDRCEALCKRCHSAAHGRKAKPKPRPKRTKYWYK